MPKEEWKKFWAMEPRFQYQQNMKVNMKADNSIALDRYAWNIGQNKAYILKQACSQPIERWVK